MIEFDVCLIRLQRRKLNQVNGNTARSQSGRGQNNNEDHSHLYYGFLVIRYYVGGLLIYERG